MERVSVKSSNLRSVAYNENSKILEIEFGKGVWQYSDVPQSIYDGLMSASSYGQYFHYKIKLTGFSSKK